MNDTPETRVRLERWSADDLPLLRRINAPEMTDHLGGPETEEQLLVRHRRYQEIDGSRGRMYRVVLLPGGEVAGSIGFWEQTWQGEKVYETGWAVLPEFQGRGVAAAAARALVERAAAEGDRRVLHAFPSVDHPASNAVCRKAGFRCAGEVDFEYPKGHPIKSNDWVIDLGPDTGDTA
ncbi:Protein N-acetyltransferase, RimJ/RimL family [Actinacidiphila alni]|uniref:Protein N-acetyltransferase, RimJ/RimL family n=1 Tax=Actinacidiphila alni TaxID=380248 RepID=A0A1I2B4E0_9ACTN|nr:GNAT family N-acetyltransferase [Actinacidiphila alni]SFE51034.1 Protein N-acetyltransferase, RimJ/RimL family [Actinacidiphila alni]